MAALMSEKQRRFRQEYQAQIHPLYNGIVHIGVMYGVGLSAIAYFVSRMDHATWEWLLVIPVFILSNLFEWWIHKNVMHRLVDVWALRAIYDRHTRQHHQYFTSSSSHGARCSPSCCCRRPSQYWPVGSSTPMPVGCSCVLRSASI